MPQVTVSLWEDAIDADVAEELISGVTDAVVSAVGEQARATTTVLVVGIPRSRWGIAGSPSSTLFPAEEA